MNSVKATELIVDQILSNRKQGAVNGTVKMQNGKKSAFSDFYKFNGMKGARLISIASYIIEIK